MKAHLLMKIEDLEKDKKYQVIKLEGEFDKLGHSEIKEELEELIKNFGASTIIFDFKKLKFINSEGIGYLMEIHTHLVKDDKQLVIIDLKSHVEDVFETIGLGEIIPIYASLNDFINSN